MTDPLNVNIPLKGVDATFPLLPEGDYELQVAESSLGPNYEKTGHQWDLVYATTSPAESVTGKPVNVGTKLFPNWPLQLQPRSDGKGGTEWEGSMAEKSLCSTIDALYGTTKDNRPDFTNDFVAGTVGRHVIGHVIIDTDKNGVQRNKVTRLRVAQS